MSEDGMHPLQRLILDRLAELDRSYRAAAAKSRGLVSHATLNAIATGRHSGNIGEDVLTGIAAALDLPVSVVVKAAGQPSSGLVEFRLPKRANQLTAAERKTVMNLVNALLEHHGK